MSHLIDLHHASPGKAASTGWIRLLRCRLIPNHAHFDQLVPHLIQGALDGAEMRTERIGAAR